MLFKSSKGSELFPKVAISVEITDILKQSLKHDRFVEGNAPALRVIRAGTWFTVHRALPYWNSWIRNQERAREKR